MGRRGPAGLGARGTAGLLAAAVALPVVMLGQSAAGPDSLTVTVRAHESAEPVTRTLRCRPAGGSHPQAAAACRHLRSLPSVPPFAPVPRGAVCSMLYGGPQTAEVQGRWLGKRVSARFTKVNGCEIDRWDTMGVSLDALLPN